MDSHARPEEAPDETLVAWWQGDPDGASGRAALAALVDRWSGRVYLWTRRLVPDRETALDVSQDCLVRMVGALPRYQARGRFGAWLFTIVHNRCRSRARPRALRRDAEIDTDDLASDDPGPEATFESAESVRAIWKAVESALDSRERAALWLRAGEGMSLEAITRVLRIEEVSGARGLLQTARRKLRAELARRAGEEEGRT